MLIDPTSLGTERETREIRHREIPVSSIMARQSTAIEKASNRNPLQRQDGTSSQKGM